MHDFSPKSAVCHAALALALVFVASTYANAQTSDSALVGMGLKSGVHWPTSSEGDRKIGSAIGLFVDYNGAGHFGALSDILFVMTPESNDPTRPHGKLDYFQIPVMARVRGGNGTVGAYGIAGPAFNLKVSGSDEFEDQTIDVVFGGGIEIKSAMIEARLARGNRDFTVGTVTSSVTQKTFQLLVGFRLR